MHPNSLANLKRYPKGVSGNPGGKPKGFETLVHEKTNGGKAMLDMLIQAVNGTLEGEPVKTSDRIRAAEILLEGGFGKVKDTVELANHAEKPINLLVATVYCVKSGWTEPNPILHPRLGLDQ